MIRNRARVAASSRLPIPLNALSRVIGGGGGLRRLSYCAVYFRARMRSEGAASGSDPTRFRKSKASPKPWYWIQMAAASIRRRSGMSKFQYISRNCSIESICLVHVGVTV